MSVVSSTPAVAHVHGALVVQLTRSFFFPYSLALPLAEEQQQPTLTSCSSTPSAKHTLAACMTVSAPYRGATTTTQSARTTGRMDRALGIWPSNLALTNSALVRRRLARPRHRPQPQRRTRRPAPGKTRRTWRRCASVGWEGMRWKGSYLN